MRNTYKITVENTKQKRPTGRPRHRCEGNIRMDLGRSRVGRCGLDSSGSG